MARRSRGSQNPLSRVPIPIPALILLSFVTSFRPASSFTSYHERQMHRALATPDIFLEIISYFRASSIKGPFASSLNRDARLSLHSLALSCKQFTECAVAVLWYRMDNLSPLFQLLENFTPDTDSPGLVGPISGEDLDRFKAYARRIRVHVPNDEGLKRVSVSTHLRVIHATGETCLLPRLQCLSVALPSFCDQLFFLLHSSLLELSIRFNIDTYSRNQDLAGRVSPALFLQSLPKKCPELSVLQLDIDDSLDAQGEINAFLTTISQMHRLKHIEIDGFLSSFEIPSDFLPTLPSFALLSSLSIGEYSAVGFSPPSATMPPIRCPALTQLKIGFDIESFSLTEGSILGSNSLPVLTALTLKVRQMQSPSPEVGSVMSRWLTLCKTVRVVAPRIASLEVDIDVDSPSSAIPFASLLEIVSERTTSLRISGFQYPSPQKADLIRLSTLAPGLESLRLALLYSDPRLLADIASTLNNLTKLELRSFRGPFPPISNLSTPSNNLRHLTIDVGRTDAENPVHIARCLNRLFPHLESFQPSGSTDRKPWDTVHEVLGALWGAREEEEMRRAEVSNRTGAN